jgi:uncharacterized protein YecE (DUF72 family)
MAYEQSKSPVNVGCAGWSIPKQFAECFPSEGSHLVRYSRRFRGVEVNSCFYRSHRPATYARWANETPPDFSFSLKVPRKITHECRLIKTESELRRFLDETALLEKKRGPLLVQLPPSFVFDAGIVGVFFEGLRRQYEGDVACEPRHRSWFAPESERLMTGFQVARVAADPAVVPRAGEPGGWGGLVYYRLHGSPRIYYSAYPTERLAAIASSFVEAPATVRAWCIFDNTALGAATGDALAAAEEFRRKPPLTLLPAK